MPAFSPSSAAPLKISDLTPGALAVFGLAHSTSKKLGHCSVNEIHVIMALCGIHEVVESAEISLLRRLAIEPLGLRLAPTAANIPSPSSPAELVLSDTAKRIIHAGKTAAQEIYQPQVDGACLVLGVFGLPRTTPGRELISRGSLHGLEPHDHIFTQRLRICWQTQLANLRQPIEREVGSYPIDRHVDQGMELVARSLGYDRVA